MKKLFTLVLANLMLVLGVFSFKPTKSVSANSAQHYWNVTNATGGPTITDGESPIVVEKENLSFYLDDETGITDAPTTEIYDSHVNAEYTFYNPSNDDIHAHLVFPMGNLPRYLNKSDDFSGYSIFADEKNVNYRLRCTFKSQYNNFNLEEDMTLLRDQKVEDSYYNSQLPVYKYTYTFSSDFDDPYRAYMLHIDHDIKKLNIISELYPHSLENNFKEFHLYEKEISIYVIGEDYDVENNTHIYERDYDERIETAISYEVTKETCNFDDLIYYYYDEKYDKTDYYNAVQDYLDTISKDSHISALNELNLNYDLLRWYDYELDFAAHSRVVNSVNAPMYPEVNYGYSSPLYTFKYLLTPASTWADFKDLHIKIYTSQYLISSEFTFTPIDGGYEVHLDELPTKDLEFTTCIEENPRRIGNIGWTILGIVLIIIFTIFTAIPIVILIITIVKKRKKVGPTGFNSMQKILLCQAIFTVLDFVLLVTTAIVHILDVLFIILHALLLVIIWIFQILECKRTNRINIRMILSFLIVLVSVIICLGEGYLYSEGVIINGLLFMLIIAILTLVAFYKSPNEMEQGLMGSTIETKGYYTIGFLEKKLSVINNVALVAYSALMLAFALLTGCDVINPGITLIAFLVLTTALIIVIYKVNVANNRDLQTYLKDLDFTKFEFNLKKKLENPRVHPETKNYYLMILAAHAMCVDLDKYIEIKSQIVYPKFRQYQSFYHGLKINFLMTKEEIEETYVKLTNEFPKDRVFKRNAQNFAKLWKPYFTGKNANESPAFTKPKTKNEFQNALFLFIRIGYYRKNNDEKAYELEREFREKYSLLRVMIDELDGKDIRQEYRELLNKTENSEDLD